VSAAYTHYGQQIDATLLVPASTSGFTITLSNMMGPAGTQNTTTGTRVHITRLSGTYAGTILVKDDAGTTLTTSAAAALNQDYVFNGTHYVTFTPVSSSP
jgi:hypothetical protein